MTRDHDHDESGPESTDEAELEHRLDQTRAELTGHVPAPDQRLEAMFATGHAPIEPRAETKADGGQVANTGAIAGVLPIEPATSPGREPAPRRRIAVVAIAASFLLVVGLAVYAAAGRGDSDAPVETAADTAEQPEPLLADGSDLADRSDDPAGGESDTGGGRDDDGSARSGEPSGQGGTGDTEGDETDDHAGELGEWLDDRFEGHFEDGEGFFGFGWGGELGPLFAENQEWFECVATTVEEWIDEQLESHEGDGSNGDEGKRVRPHLFELGELDIEGECGEPVIAEGFVWPDFEWPDDFELPDDFEGPDDFEWPDDFELPGFNEEFCEKTETDDGVSIACRWPPDHGGDGEGGLRFRFGFDLDELDFDVEELEGQLRERFGDLEERLKEHFGEGDLEERLKEHFGELEPWLQDLERHSDNEA